MFPEMTIKVLPTMMQSWSLQHPTKTKKPMIASMHKGKEAVAATRLLVEELGIFYSASGGLRAKLMTMNNINLAPVHLL
jgi:hypothetical protein